MNDNENKKSAGSMEKIVLNQIQTTPNRRILSGMKSFQVDAETPDSMTEMLRRLERAEASRARMS